MLCYAILSIPLLWYAYQRPRRHTDQLQVPKYPHEIFCRRVNRIQSHLGAQFPPLADKPGMSAETGLTRSWRKSQVSHWPIVTVELHPLDCMLRRRQ